MDLKSTLKYIKILDIDMINKKINIHISQVGNLRK